jgi:hypothetical protein
VDDFLKKFAPKPPIYCGPPLHVELNFKKLKKPKKRSLFEELFGTDLNPLLDTLNNSKSEEQRQLSSEILGGVKTVKNLSPEDKELLDQIAMAFNYIHNGIKTCSTKESKGTIEPKTPPEVSSSDDENLGDDTTHLKKGSPE